MIFIKKCEGKYKFVAIIGKKRIAFGARGYSDYRIHRDKKRKANYIARHRARENWNDIYSKGFWSRWLLWNKETLQKSIADTAKRFDLSIRYLL